MTAVCRTTVWETEGACAFHCPLFFVKYFIHDQDAVGITTPDDSYIFTSWFNLHSFFFTKNVFSCKEGEGGQTVAQTTRNCILTRFDAVDNLRIVTLVFVQSSDLKHSRANSGRFKDTARVRRAYKPGCIVVSVIHIDNNTHKVPLDRDVLVSDLGRQNFQAESAQHEQNIH